MEESQNITRRGILSAVKYVDELKMDLDNLLTSIGDGKTRVSGNLLNKVQLAVQDGELDVAAVESLLGEQADNLKGYLRLVTKGMERYQQTSTPPKESTINSGSRIDLRVRTTGVCATV